jgi:hypothetical protein
MLPYFSVVSLCFVVAATVGLSGLYRQTALADLIRLGEANNAERAVVFANTVWPRFSDVLGSSSGFPTDAEQANSELQSLHEAVQTMVQGTSVVKVKIYALDGRTMYSSEPLQIGEVERANPRFLAARSGSVSTESARRDHFGAFEQRLPDREILSSDLPLRRTARTGSGGIRGPRRRTPFLEAVKHPDHGHLGGGRDARALRRADIINAARRPYRARPDGGAAPRRAGVEARARRARSAGARPHAGAGGAERKLRGEISVRHNAQRASTRASSS